MNKSGKMSTISTEWAESIDREDDQETPPGADCGSPYKFQHDACQQQQQHQHIVPTTSTFMFSFTSVLLRRLTTRRSPRYIVQIIKKSKERKGKGRKGKGKACNQNSDL